MSCTEGRGGTWQEHWTGVFKISPIQTRVGESGVSHDAAQDTYTQRESPLHLEDPPSSSHGLALMLPVLRLLLLAQWVVTELQFFLLSPKQKKSSYLGIGLSISWHLGSARTQHTGSSLETFFFLSLLSRIRSFSFSLSPSPSFSPNLKSVSLK